MLREELGLAGTQIACDRAECGACAVHLDGRAAYACTVLAVQVDGKRIGTIEGLQTGDRQTGEPALSALHPAQRAFG